MHPLSPQSACNGGKVSPSWVVRFAAVTLPRQLSVRRDSLMPSLTAFLITTYRTYMVIAKLIAYAIVPSTSITKTSRRMAISNCVHCSMVVPPGRHFDGLTPAQVCDAEFRSAKRTVRPSASQESAPRPLRAPRAVKAQGATRNALQWQQIALHLTDRVVNP